jgi:hypothetical protein
MIRPEHQARRRWATQRSVRLTWPEVWTWDRLQNERFMKPNRFRSIHLLDSRAEMGEHAQGRVDASHPARYRHPIKYARYYIGIDPAPGSSQDDPDFFNITVGAMHGTNLDIVECFDTRADVTRQVELVGTHARPLPADGSGVVAVGGAKITLDRYFRGALTIARPDLTLISWWRSASPVTRRSVWKVLVLTLSRASCAAGRIGWALPPAADQWQESSLMEQWRDFPHGRHDDKLDGLDVMTRTAREFANVDDVTWDLEVLES